MKRDLRLPMFHAGSTSRGLTCLVMAVSMWVMLVASGAGLADTKVKNDANDTPGGLDIASVSHGHRDRQLTHRMTMYEAWDNSVLADDARIYFTFYGLRSDTRTINVDVSPDGTLYGEVIRWDGETVLGYVKVWRPDDRTVQIQFPKRTLQHGGLKRYSWDALTISRGPEGSECDGDSYLCADDVPDGATVPDAYTKNIVHRLR